MKRCDAQQEHFGPLLGYCDHQMMKLMVRKLRGYDVAYAVPYTDLSL